MNVKHGTLLEVRVVAGRRVLSNEVVPAEQLDAHLMVQSYCHGGAFGQANWHANGQPLDRAPKVDIRLVNPADELAPGQLCDCETCKSGG